VVTRLLLLALVACGNKAKPAGEDAARTPRVDATVPAPPDAPAAPALGEAAIRVEWKAVPTAARQSPGRTSCNTARPGSVAPTTMWGIPEAIVLVEPARAPTEARVVLAPCTLTPRVALATTLIVESALDKPAKVTLVKHGTAAKLDALQAGEARTFQLPVAGHAVSIALDAGGVYQLAIDGAADTESSWIVAAAGGVTDVTGLATLALPAGTHAVTAWLPSRGGQPPRLAKASVTVEKDALAELAIDLGTP
jgi:hypothetical protein